MTKFLMPDETPWVFEHINTTQSTPVCGKNLYIACFVPIDTFLLTLYNQQNSTYYALSVLFEEIESILFSVIIIFA